VTPDFRANRAPSGLAPQGGIQENSPNNIVPADLLCWHGARIEATTCSSTANVQTAGVDLQGDRQVAGVIG